MDEQQVKNIIEAGLLVAGRPLSISQLHALFQDDKDAPDKAAIRTAIASLREDYEDRGIELVEVSSGFRMQSRQELAPWMAHLFQEKAPRYSRALLETLVLIAYKQPITRAEIEQVRGVAVSSNIVRTLQERNWVNVVGHKDLPGKPALLGTTRQFLDYFNLKRLDALPRVGEIKDIDQIDSFAAEEAALVEQGLIKSPDESADETTDDAGVAGAAIAVGGIDIALTDGAEQLDLVEQNEIDVELETVGEDNAEATESEEEVDTDLEASDEEAADVELKASDEEAADVELEASDEDAADVELETSDEVISADVSPESQLKQVLADFASEHQQQVDVQREMEERNLSKPVGPAADDSGDGQATALATDQSADDEDQDTEEPEELALEEALDASLNIQQGDMPKPGDTLH
jgi:segregation and condensation protein B